MSRASAVPSERTRVKRLPERGCYDRAAIDAVLDAMPLAHVAYVLDGAPIVTPTLQWREGDHVYWHGSAASRMLEAAEDAPVCMAVTLMDGLVLARSAFHHSVNYRSVMLMGRAAKVADPAEKELRLRNFVDGLFAGRWDMLRPANRQELKATTVLTMPITEASAKLRAGPPKDDDEDYALPIWAGVLPIRLTVGQPIDDPRNKPGLKPPAHVTGFSIG
ncbi:MAG: pyridoxamine 5'-phosphate oxidase family protein [Alphaproteobacteria bacterium]|nr:pyridoxamine 5'-phosphate oxidase family protein [Alphaproteobacteria bacterium]